MIASYGLPQSFFLVSLSACMLWVIVSDSVHYIISNRLNAVVLALFIGALFFLPIQPFSALAAAAIILLIGLGFFALGLMGGGDIKLLVVLSLWTGWGLATLQFIFLTGIFGGLLVFIVLPLRWMAPSIWHKFCKSPLPRLLTRKQPVPYGIAIASAFAWLLWTGELAVLVQ